MSTPGTVTISSAVEGLVDEAVVRRLITHVGATPGTVYGKRGKLYLQDNILRYNAAAQHYCWLVLTDLDHDAACAPGLRAAWLPSTAPGLCFRIAVRTIETWLLADRERLARFLSIHVKHIPLNPENEHHPKVLLVNLARRSKKRAIREDMVPKQQSSRQIGPAYTSRLMEFVQDSECGWRPDIAAQSADSLRRCIDCLRQLATSSMVFDPKIEAH